MSARFAATQYGDTTWETDDYVAACDYARHEAGEIMIQWTGVVGVRARDVCAHVRANGGGYSRELLALVEREVGRRLARRSEEAS